MKLNIKKINTLLVSAVICSPLLFSGCEDFLDQDPLSFFEPKKTFTTEEGVAAVLTSCDKHLRDYYMRDGNMKTDLLFSDMGVRGKTDDQNMFCNIDATLTPTAMKEDTQWFWDENYSGIKYANTVISYIDKVEGLDEETKNAYLGRAYFHRSYRYLLLAFQFNNVPLVSKLLEVPKQDFASVKREALLQMITKDMEFAVQWVPEQKDMNNTGQVNKGACRQLLIKCYLATGQFEKAKNEATILINQSGFRLMQEEDNFGTFIPSGEPKTWTVTSNIIWNLHRPENKLTSDNKEVLFGVISRGTGSSFRAYTTMRQFGPFWNDAKIIGPNEKSRAVNNWARNNAKYNAKYDYLRVVGRGIAEVRPTYYATHTIWTIDGTMDNGDLRHSSTKGNWFPMDSLKYNDPASPNFGKTFYEASPVCPDTVRSWFDFPLYKIYLKDASAEANQASTNFQGSSSGSISDWYVYRLAETYLLRAEAYFYMGQPGMAARDVNEVRKRAKCERLYPENGTFSIGDIMDERARELYLEEFRHAELSRVSYCLALSGKADEWGNTYDLSTYDKQEGIDRNGGSYWYQRIIHYNDFYNTGHTINANGMNFSFVINKHNLYWPVPNDAITKNSLRPLAQNFGYDGYDPDVKMWNTWEEAVADEATTE